MAKIARNSYCLKTILMLRYHLCHIVHWLFQTKLMFCLATKLPEIMWLQNVESKGSAAAFRLTNWIVAIIGLNKRQQSVFRRSREIWQICVGIIVDYCIICYLVVECIGEFLSLIADRRVSILSAIREIGWLNASN